MRSSTRLKDGGDKNPLANYVVADENALIVLVWYLGL